MASEFIADITGRAGEAVGNSLRIRPISDLPSLNVADWVGLNLIGIYPLATATVAQTIIGRPLGCDGPAFVAIEPIASGGSLVKWVEYTEPRRSLEKIISLTSANRTDWKRTDAAKRRVFHQLSMPGNGALVDTELTRHVRLPVKLFAAVDSWELVFKNFNDISSTNRGAIDMVDVWIAKRASDGNGGFTQNFAEPPTKLGVPFRYSVGESSERYAITDIHFQLEANVEYLISYAYTTPGGGPNHMGIGGSYLGTVPSGVASMSVTNTWSPYTPLDVYIKAKASPDVPFYMYPGSSSETGLNTDYPLRDCWGWRHAEANGAIPALLGQSGASLDSYVSGSNYYRQKLSTTDPADKVIGHPGSNDIYGGASLTQVKTSLGQFGLFVRRFMGQTFELTEVFPRRTETAAIKAVREGFNDYLRTLPLNALVCHNRASAVTGTDGLMRAEFDSGDGIHLNTAGQHAMAAAIINSAPNLSAQDSRLTKLEAEKFVRTGITTLAEADALRGAAAVARYPVNSTAVFGALGNLDVYYNAADGRTKHIFMPSAPGLLQDLYRNYSGGAWSAMLPATRAALLPSGVDFRTLTSPATYSIQFTNHPNMPPSPTPGTLEVLPASGGVTHRFTELRSPQKVITCSLNGATWSVWSTPTSTGGGGGGTPPTMNGFSIPMRAELAANAFTIQSKIPNNIMSTLSDDRTRGWNSGSADFAETLDEGKTWALVVDKNGSNVFAGATVESVITMDNGEILVTCLRGNPGLREIWTSKNIANQPTRTFSRRYVARAPYIKFTAAWSQSDRGPIVLINEYGPKTPTWDGQPVAAGENACKVLASFDYGDNFTEVFDLNDYLRTVQGRTSTDNQHLHGVAWDPYWDRIWVTFGDNSGGNGSNGIIYSDDLFETVATAQFYSGTTPPYQCVGILPMPTCVLFFTDNVPVGSPDVVRLNRSEGKTKTGFYTPVAAFESTAAGKHLCQSFTRQNRPGDDGVAMAAFSAEGEAAPSFAVATLDGYVFKEFWRDTVNNPSGFGSRSIVGPTLRGKAILKLNDQKNPGLWTQVTIDAPGY
ncbi:hypothetical protein [Pseudarthrobacter sp. PS3-L1]|uniref:hypothetical protein n=1 Tax=Pseudarthrobacter sp. PS3-L1 TaxID=3046207 RepID=UPI0024B9C075|nr:hypothetical protein [Pseudarthrobacter sp. PS3-L1]MDJ0321819.1 hypothetical protein [Pseudarthrobacter sp. PS3-L1]